jgi:hypothetical protein
MKINIYKLVFTGVLVITSIVSCSDKLEVFDVNNPTTESYFKTAAELQNGINAAYSTMRSAHIVAREWFYLHDMRSGECSAGGPQLESPRAELINQITPSPSNSVVSDVWGGLYKLINRTNLVLSKAPGVTDNIALRDRIVGEAKFLRAWAYFELVSQWGSVPLYTENATSTTDFKPKAPVADIYSFIIKDLNEASLILPVIYNDAENGRATKGAAFSLLGKVQMQKGDYTAARTALLEVYGKYSLVDYQWNFDGDVLGNGGILIAKGHEFNAESIFEVVFVDKGDNDYNWGSVDGEGPTSAGTTVRNQEYGVVWGNIIPSNSFLSEFEANDPRYKFTIFEEGDQFLTQAPTGPKTFTKDNMNVATSTKDGVTIKRVFRKYNIYDWSADGYHPSGINARLIRYADVLLMLAECEAEVGTPTKAANYINEVRSRPGVEMPLVTVISKNEALQAVMHERTVELGVERVANIDILRWRQKGYFPSIIADRRPGQVNFFPIPAIETSTNPLIK